jgi:hypothetical protein
MFGKKILMLSFNFSNDLQVCLLNSPVTSVRPEIKTPTFYRRPHRGALCDAHGPRRRSILESTIRVSTLARTSGHHGRSLAAARRLGYSHQHRFPALFGHLRGRV